MAQNLNNSVSAVARAENFREDFFMAYAGKIKKKHISRGRSKRQFKKTVLKSHSANNMVMRGGTRL